MPFEPGGGGGGGDATSIGGFPIVGSPGEDRILVFNSTLQQFEYRSRHDGSLRLGTSGLSTSLLYPSYQETIAYNASQSFGPKFNGGTWFWAFMGVAVKSTLAGNDIGLRAILTADGQTEIEEGSIHCALANRYYAGTLFVKSKIRPASSLTIKLGITGTLAGATVSWQKTDVLVFAS